MGYYIDSTRHSVAFTQTLKLSTYCTLYSVHSTPCMNTIHSTPPCSDAIVRIAFKDICCRHTISVPTRHTTCCSVFYDEKYVSVNFFDFSHNSLSTTVLID